MQNHIDTRHVGLDRRGALRLAVALSCLATVGACRTTGSPAPELESARSELMRALDELERSELEEVRLMTIARAISDGARLVVDEQVAFLVDLDRLLRNRDVAAADIQAFADEFAARRTRVRNDLFRLQDELRAELGADEWARVVVALNRKADVATWKES